MNKKLKYLMKRRTSDFKGVERKNSRKDGQSSGREIKKDKNEEKKNGGEEIKNS